MIGQTHLLDTIQRRLDNFPRFSIIVGPKGSGKKQLCKEIISKLNMPGIYFNTKIEDVRKMIDLAYKQSQPVIFLLCDADKMNVAAKNTLLKITEEPPNNCYVIMTLQNISNTLPTIQSRGTLFQLDNYSEAELSQYRLYRGYKDIYDDIVKLVCSTTGEVDELFSYDVQKFHSFAKCICENIQVPTNGNAFKIVKSMKLKDEDDGFDPILVLKAVQKIFLYMGKQTKKKKYLLASIETGRSLQQLNQPSISKQGVLDMWIINVRAQLMVPDKEG